MMNSLLTKIYNNYTIIYIQHSSNQLCIKKYYNIIRAWHTQLTSVSKNGS